MTSTCNAIGDQSRPLLEDAEALRKEMFHLQDVGELPVFRNKVKRKELGILIGISPVALISSSNTEKWAWARSCIDSFDEYLGKQAERQEVLKTKLDELYESDKLPLYRGSVARSRLEKFLCFPSGSLRKESVKWGWAKRCVDEFDKVLREKGHGTVWEEKVPAIRAHLAELHEARKLPINQQGELNKVAILTLFGLTKRGSPWVCEKRAPLLKKLLDEYSEIVSDSDYSQYKYEYLKDALNDVLLSPDMPLTHGRLVSIKSIGMKLGVDRSALRNTPLLMALIEQKQREVDLSLRHGQTKKKIVVGGVTYINIGATPWSEKHGRVFDFSELAEPYSLGFAEKVGTVFVHVASKLEAPKSYYSRIKHFLLWLSEHDGSREVVGSFSEGKLPSRDLFERSALTYQQAVLAEVRNNVREADNQRKLPQLAVISKFSDARVFPRVTFPSQKRSRRKGEKDRNPKPSLVEAEAKDAASIKRITEDAARYRDIEFDSNKDTIAFANTLAAERARREDLPEGLVESIAFLCEERLYELRKESTRVFRQWYETYQNGRKLIAQATYRGIEIKRQLDLVRGTTRRAWSDKVAQLFPHKDSDYALCNVLALVEEEFHGVCPLGHGSDWNFFWSKTYAKVGGSAFVQAHLLPTSEVVSAAVCLYLCESGSNSGVGLVLEPTSIRKSKLPNHANIVSTKARSMGKSIFCDLPVKTGIEEVMSAVEALNILKAVTQPLRDKKVIERSDLVVFASRGAHRNLKEWHLRQDVGEIAGTSNVLSGFTITPSMIRPTVLLHAQLKHPGNLTVANMVAQHNDETTTMGYVAKLPFRMILEERIRMFMDTLQVVMASGVDEGQRKLGIDSNDWAAMVEHSQRTGLGLFCSNPFEGAQADYPAGEKCRAVERCIECSKRLVIAHTESIADMIIWQEALENAQAEWLEARCQRWEEVWTPWQAFFHVVLNEKMSRGELAVIKKQATSIAEERKNSPNFSFPEPW